MSLHIIEKGLIDVASGFRYHEAISVCLKLINKSISGLPKWSVIFLNSMELSCHSLASSKIHDCSSASLFSSPGNIWTADIYNFLAINNSHIFEAISLQDLNLTPPIFLIENIAVMLSHITLSFQYENTDII